MKFAIVALTAVMALTAQVSAEDIACQDKIEGVKAIDNGPITDFWHDGLKEFVRGAFYFNKTGVVYRMNFGELQADYNEDIRVLTFKDESCAHLRIQYRQVPNQRVNKAESMQLLLKQSEGDVKHVCTARNPPLSFGIGERYSNAGKQFIDCFDQDTVVTTLIVNKFQMAFVDPYSDFQPDA